MHGLYPILDAGHLAQLAILPEELAPFLARLSIHQVQLRCKSATAPFAAFAQPWVTALRHHAPAIKIILNDNLELAVALDVDGVHVGQEDCQAALCRQRLGSGKLLGVSTHDEAEIQQAVVDGADYVGFGPIFSTHSKSDTRAVQGLNRLRQVCRASPLPIAAIGGIAPQHLADIAATGAASAAMISGLLAWDWQKRLTDCSEIWQKSCRGVLP